MIFGQQNIFRLDVPMNNLVLFVYGMDSLNDMASIVVVERLSYDSIELGLFPKLTSLGVLHLQKEMQFILKSSMQLHHIFTVCMMQ